MSDFSFKVYNILDGPLDGIDLIPAHQQRQWMNQTLMPHAPENKDHAEKGFANRCLPLLMANQMGWDVINMIPFVATSMPPPDGRMIFHWLEGRQPVRGGPRNNFGENLLTWPSPWTFNTPPGWDLLITPPPNVRMPQGVDVLSALVETDHSPATFTFNWHIEAGRSVWVERDQPICRLIPYPTGELEKFKLEMLEGRTPEYEQWLNDRMASTIRSHEDPENAPWEKAYWKVAKRLKIKRRESTR